MLGSLCFRLGGDKLAYHAGPIKKRNGYLIYKSIYKPEFIDLTFRVFTETVGPYKEGDLGKPYPVRIMPGIGDSGSFTPRTETTMSDHFFNGWSIDVYYDISISSTQSAWGPVIQGEVIAKQYLNLSHTKNTTFSVSKNFACIGPDDKDSVTLMIDDNGYLIGLK